MRTLRYVVLKTGYGLAVLLGVIGLALLPIGPAIAATGVPKILNYQGRLMDANGVLLGGSGTEYCFKFSLYDNPTVGSGSKLWPASSPSTTTASVKNGVFSVGIGDTNIGGDVLDFNFQDTDTVYVQVEVATKVGPTCAFGDGGEVFETLSPRQRIHASGYAINAGTVGGFLAAQYATGNQIPVLSSGSLILGDVNPFINATTSNALTLQGGGQATGDIQFFSSANKITQAGNATFAGNVTAASSTIANATSTTFFATLGRFTSAIFDTLSAVVASITNLTTTNFITTNATTTNATTTNFAVTSLASALLSTNAQGTLVATTSISSNYIDTSGNWLGLFDGQEGGYYLANSFSTTSAEYFANASTTIPKTYSDNTFTGGNVFGNTTTTNATTTNLSVSGLASTSGLIVSNLNATSCDVKANQFGVLSCGADATGGGADPFSGNATTTLLTFSGGLMAFGSSTVANLSSSNATITNATSSSFFSTLARFTSAIVDSLTATVATITNLTATNSTTTNATTTNLYASAVTSLSGLFGNLTATTSVNLASTTAQGRLITGNIISTSTATSSFAGPLRVGTNDSSYQVSFVGSTTAPTSATGTAVLAVTNTNPTLSSGTNILRLNMRTGFGTTCTSASTCPRFIEYINSVGDNTDRGGIGVGSLRLSTAGTGITQTSGAADFAEYMILNSAASVGDLVSLNSNGEYQLAVAGQSLIGVVSDNPAFVGNANLEGEPNAYVVGFAGVIETTVSDANGPITAGSFIAASTTPGVGVKLVSSGYALGQALETWSGPGTGQISVLVFPKYVDAAVALDSYGGTQGGISGYWSLATSTGVISFASSTYSLSLNKFSTTNATTTNLAIQGVTSALLSTDANGRVVATTSLSSSLIDTTGNWTGTLDGYEGNYLIANAFSTTSANFWKNQNNFFSTSSAQYFAAAGLAWSTTSADAWKATNNFFSTSSATYLASVGLSFSTTSAQNFADSSTTIAKTYTANTFTNTNTFTGQATFGNASSTNLTVSDMASTTNLVVSSLNAASCDVKATAAGVLICGTDATGTTVQDAFVNGATSTLLTFNAGLITFGSSTIQNLSSSNATITNATSTSFFSSLARFTTGIVDSLSAAVATITNLSATNIITTNATSTNSTTTNFAITSVQNALLSTDANGRVVATTSISGNYIEKTGNWTGTFDGFEGSYYLANSFSTTSALAFTNAGLAFSTTSNDYWKSVNNFFSTSSSLYFASAGLSFSTTSAQHFLLQNQGAAFSTTSANHFTDSSTTIAKTYSDNTFTGGNVFQNTTSTNATSTTFFASLGRFTSGIVDSLTASVASITSLTSTNVVATNSTSTNATTTNFAIQGVTSALLSTDANGRVVATTSISSSLIDTTGNWTGTLDGYEGNYLIANSFSTSSANFWKNQNNFFSTSSAQYFAAAGLAWSTTSADAWKATNNFFSTSSAASFAQAGLAWSTTSAINFIDSSSTIPKTYTENVFTSGNTFLNTTTTNATTTNLAVSGTASTSQLIVSNLNATSCDVKATAAGVLICGTDNSGVTLQDAFSNGATTTMLTFSNGLMAFGSSTIANLSGTNATVTNATSTSFFSTLARFTTAITDSLTAAVATITNLTSTNFITVNSTSTNATTTNLAITTLPSTVLTTDVTGRVVATTSISGNYIEKTGDWTGTLDGREGNYYIANSFSTTSATYFTSVGLSFSTTSADAWKAVNNFYSTTSATYFASAGLSFSTTSADAWKVTRDFFSTSSAQYLASVGLSWSTTSANYFATSFIDASTTIPKLYSSNIWTSGNIFGNTTTTNATTTNLSVSGTASTTQLIVSSLNAVNCDVKASALGVLTCGTDSGGIDPFPGNATTSVLTFTSGLLTNASSTIGNGTAAGGITVRGNATTTGKLIVQGNATSTFAQGIDIAAGCFSVNGECISTGGGSSGVLVNIQTFSSPGTTTYTPSAGAVTAEVIVTGAGGGGGGADGPDTTNETIGAGGGAGGTSISFIDLTSTTSVQVVVGSGGVAGANTGTTGGTGGHSAFSTYASSTGGTGGVGSVANATGCLAQGGIGSGGVGGAGRSGDVNVTGGAGSPGSCAGESVVGGTGGSSHWGGGGAGGVDPNGNLSSAGSAGAAYGSGGGGASSEDTTTGAAGGAGANGIIVIYEYGPYTGVMGIDDGGTGTTTAPTYGQILVGNSLGGYDLVATSSLGITGGGGSGADPFPGNATNTTLTFNGGLFATGSSTVENLKGSNATITNATSTSFFSTLARFTTSIVDSLTATIATITNLTATNATTTNFAVVSLPNTVLTTNADGTVVATTSISGNYIEKTGNWTGTFDGLEGNYYIANSFSTTSANYFTVAGLTFSTTSADAWKVSRDFFSTSSAQYLASVGLSWSTTSATYFTNTFVDASTTIPKVYSTNTWTGNNIFNGTLTLGTLNGPLHANNGVVSATTSIGAVYGGTGQSSYAVGDILYASAANTLTKLSAGANGTVLKLAGGVPTWGTDNSGGGGGAGAWSTSTNDMFLSPADPTDIVVVGNNATTTTTSIFEVIGKSYFSNVVGIGTTSPGTLLSVGGVANFAPSLSTFYSALSLGNLTATSSLTVSGQTTFVNASSTAVGALDYLAVGRNGTTTIQGNSTGTSTVQGFINVTGTNSTSTFSGGLVASRLALTGAATSTAARGIDIASGCFAINGNCIGGVTSVSAANSSVTITPSEGNVQVSLNLANSNTWTGLQVFSGSASTTAVSALDYIAVGRTATTTIQGNTTGTSTIQGFVNVTGTNSTSTFSGNVQVARIISTGTATSSFAGGINLTGGGCVALNGTCIKSGTDGVEIYASTTAGVGTWTAPAGIKFAQVIVTGAGGGGGGAAGTAADTDTQAGGGGGGAGATTIETFTQAEIGSSQSFTVGARGTAGSDVGGAGTDGGASYFGTLLGANGGIAGLGAITTVNALGSGGAGGAATTTGDITLVGGDGMPGMSATEGANGGNGGGSYWGSGGEGGGSTAAGSVAGSAGSAIGAGGGGGGTTDDNATPWAAGGNGAVGGVFVFSYTASGADLAEWYPSEPDVLPGDIVAISDETLKYESFSLGEQRISKMKKAEPGDKVVGVVATLPHTVMGGEILGDAEHASPVALAGRVPVKVSTENGVIRAGDYLSISSVPGVAKRATKAGVTIGKALEDANCAVGENEEVASSTEEVLEDMVAEDCKVMVLVNTTYTSGILLKSALAEAGIMLNEVPEDIDASRIALAYMLQEKKNFTATTELSEVSTDRIAAGLEIITPRVLANTLVVDAIEPVEKDVRIRVAEGGAFIIEKIAQDDMSLMFDTASSTESLLAVSIDELGNALFSGTLTAANFEVGTEESPGGITMYDKETREPYCLIISGGSLKTESGKCGSSVNVAAANSLFTDAPPIIVVHGQNPVRVEIGETYVDAGATATDDHDEDVTVSATIDGRNLEGLELDTSKDTNYTVTYRAVDSRGNIGRAIRTIIVGTGFAPEPDTVEEGNNDSASSTPEVAGDTRGERDSSGESSVTQAPAAEPQAQAPAPEPGVSAVPEPAPEVPTT